MCLTEKFNELTSDYAQMARNEGYNFRINKFNSSTAAKCPNCGTAESMFSQNSLERHIFQPPNLSYEKYVKSKCFKCGLGSTGNSNWTRISSDGRIAFMFLASNGSPDPNATILGKS